MSKPATKVAPMPTDPVWQRWAVLVVLIATVVLSVGWVAGHVDSGIGRRAAQEADRQLGLAVARMRAAIETTPSLRGDELVAVASTGVGSTWHGAVISSEVTDSGAAIDVFVDGNATEGGGLFSTDATRRLCVRLIIEPASVPQFDFGDIKCAGSAAEMPSRTRETDYLRHAVPAPTESRMGDGICYGTSGDCPGG